MWQGIRQFYSNLEEQAIYVNGEVKAVDNKFLFLKTNLSRAYYKE
jgi:hypothetical protein